MKVFLLWFCLLVFIPVKLSGSLLIRKNIQNPSVSLHFKYKRILIVNSTDDVKIEFSTEESTSFYKIENVTDLLRLSPLPFQKELLLIFVSSHLEGLSLVKNVRLFLILSY